MSEIIFARTRWEYDSYKDYHELVRLSGFQQVYIDEIDLDSDNVYIFTPANGEIGEGFRAPHKCRIIHHQLEWQTDNTNNVPPGVDEVWASDPSYAQQIGARYVVLGSHPGLGADRRLTYKTYDVVMLQYLTPRRQRIRHDLLQAGITIAPDGWGEQRSESLMHSRLMLHVHQHENVKTIAPLRWAIAAAYHLPVLSEAIAAKENIPPTLQTSYEDFMYSVNFWLGPGKRDWLAAEGEALYQYLCIDHTFRHEVEGAL